MSVSKPKWTSWFLLLAALLGASGCGGSGEGDNDAGDAASSVPSVATSPTTDDASAELNEKCQDAIAGTLGILNPKWRELVLDVDYSGAQVVGASGWILLFTEAETVAQGQGCTGEMDYFTPLRQSIDAYTISAEAGFPNFAAITDSLNAESALYDVPAP